MTDIVQIQESEYDAILRQTVAVIDRTRAMVATTVCSAIGTAHWEIGKLLHDKKIESKHGSGKVTGGLKGEQYGISWQENPHGKIPKSPSYCLTDKGESAFCGIPSPMFF